MVTSTPALAHTDNFSVVCGAVHVRARRHTPEKKLFYRLLMQFPTGKDTGARKSVEKSSQTDEILG